MLLFFCFSIFGIELDLKSFVFVKLVAIDCFDSFKRSESLGFLLNREFVIFWGLSFNWSLVRVCLSDIIIGVVEIFVCVTYISRRGLTWFRVYL